MRDWYLDLPRPLQVATTVLVAIVLLVALFFAYDWIGTKFLDSGGTLG